MVIKRLSNLLYILLIAKLACGSWSKETTSTSRRESSTNVPTQCTTTTTTTTTTTSTKMGNEGHYSDLVYSAVAVGMLMYGDILVIDDWACHIGFYVESGEAKELDALDDLLLDVGVVIVG